MMEKLGFQNHQVLKFLIIFIAVITVLAASLSGLFLSTSIVPIIVGSVPLIFVIIIMIVRRPALTLYAALLINLLPLGLIPVSLQSNLNRLLAVVALLVWGVYLLVKRGRVVWTTTATIMVVFLVWSLLSFFWARNTKAATDELGAYILRFIIFMILVPNEIKSRKNLDSMMLVLAIAGWIHIIAGMVTVANEGYEFGTRLQIIDSNANSFGVLYSIAAIGMIWMAVRQWNPRKRFWNSITFVFILFSFVIVALTGSRGGAISWVITMFLLLLWPQTRIWGIRSVLVLVVALIGASFILTTTINRFTSTSSDTLGGRVGLWQAAWVAITDHPITGVGIGNSAREIMAYVRLFRSVGNEIKASIHNPILTIWVETGIPGMLLYLGILLSALWLFVRKYLDHRKLKVQWIIPYYALTAAGFVGYFASWIKGGGMETSFSYFLMLSLLIIPSHIEIGEEGI